jgi:hypothetical protein
MYLRDVIKATAKVGGITPEALLAADKGRKVAALRQLGLLVSSRLTDASWPLIGRVWGQRDRATVQAAALKADARLASGDQLTRRELSLILAELDVRELPCARPPAAAYRYRPATIRTRIRETEARLRTLHAQLMAMEASS